MRIYVDSPSRVVREAFCRALSTDPECEAHCELLPKCQVAFRDLQTYRSPFPAPFSIPTLALVHDLRSVGPALLKQRYRGVLGESDSFETLLQALRAVCRGEIWAPRQLIADAFFDSSPPSLTAREQEVLRHVTQGLSNRAIAEELDISVRTVKSYVSSLLAKHETKSRVELILHYSDNAPVAS